MFFLAYYFSFEA